MGCLNSGIGIVVGVDAVEVGGGGRDQLPCTKNRGSNPQATIPTIS